MFCRTVLPVLCSLSRQVAYQRILQLTYVEDLLNALKTLFIKLFQPFLTTFVASLHVTTTVKLSASADTHSSWNFAKAFDGWDAVFDKLLRGLEDKAAQVRTFTFASMLYLTSNSRNGAHVPGMSSAPW